MKQIQTTNDYSTKKQKSKLLNGSNIYKLWLFVLSFPRNNNTDSRYSYSNNYVPEVEINDFNVLIDGKVFFNVQIKNPEEAYKKIIEISNNNDYTIDNLLEFTYFKKHYKLIAIDVSKQTKLKEPQQIVFIGKNFKNTGATMFFSLKNQKNNF